MIGKKQTQPDEIQREFWQYRRVWVATIAILIAARFIFPHIPLLKGWEQKFTASAFEMGKLDIPNDAAKVSTIDAVNLAFKGRFEIPMGLGDFNGPILVAAWPCAPVGEPGACLRYLWNTEPLTLVVSFKPKRTNKNNGPFARTGWGGFFIVDKALAAAAVGPFDPRDIEASWPYAAAFSNRFKK